MLLVAFVGVACQSASPPPAQEYELEISAVAEPKTLPAPYRLWIPKGCARIRCVFVINRRAAGQRVYFRDSEWRSLASRLDAAMLWCGFEVPEVQSTGAGESMLVALHRFAKLSAHPELASAKLLLWGHSMGGRVAQDFVRWKPERVLGFVIATRGYPSDPEFMQEPTEAMKVPGLYLMAERDRQPADIREHFLRARKNRSPRAWIVLPGQGHWPEGMSSDRDETTEKNWRAWAAHEVVLPWIEDIVRSQPVDLNQGWLLDAPSGRIERAGQTADLSDSAASWFPSRGVAEACLKYLRGEQPATSLPEH
jgi:hypothetical protein